MQQLTEANEIQLKKNEPEKTVTFFAGGKLCTVQGGWQWHLQCDAIYCSDVMMGWPEQFTGTKAIFHPDDKHEVLEGLTLIQQGAAAGLQFRIITTYGEITALTGHHLFIAEEAEEPQPTPIAALLKKETDALEGASEAAQNAQQKTSYNYAERISNAGVWYMNSATGETWYSDQVYRIYGFPPQTLNAHYHTFHPFIHPDDAAEVKAAMEAAATKQAPLHIRFRIVLPAGNERYVQQSTTWSFNSKGQQVMHGMLQDVTEQKETEKRCEDNESAISFQRQLLHLTEAATNIGYWQVNVLTKKMLYSDNHYRLFGIKPQSVPANASTFLNYIHPDDRAIYEEVQRKMRKEHAAPEIDYRIIRADGKTRFLRQKARAIISGAEVLVAGTIQDITVQRGLEKKLAEAKEEEQVKAFTLRQTEAVTVTGTWLWNLTTGEMEWSDNFYELLGLKPGLAKLSQKILLRNIHPDDQTNFTSQLAATLHESQPANFIFRLISRGQVRYMKAVFHLQTYNGVTYFIAAAHDITQAHTASEALKERMRLIETLTDSLPVQMIITDAENAIVLWNKASELVYKKRREKVLGQNFFDVFPSLKNETVIDRFSRVMAGETIRLMDQKGRYGIEGIYNIAYVPIFSGEGTVNSALHLLEDVTDKHRVQQQLHNRLRFIEKLLEAAVDRIIVLDQNLTYLYWNKQAETFYGLSKEAVVGKNILEIFPNLAGHPSYAQLRRALRGEAVHLPAQLLDDNPVPFETWLLPVANEKGEVEAVLWMVHDLTNEFILTKEQKKAQQILDTIQEACVELDAQSRVVYANNKAVDFWQQPKEALLQQTIWQLFPMMVDTPFYFAVKYAQEEKALIQREFLSVLSNRWLNVIITPTETGVIILFFDVHEIKQARQQVEDEHRRMLEAQAIGHIGSFEWRVGEEHSKWSDELYRINGIAPQSEDISQDLVDALIYPPDWEGLQKVKDQSLATPGFYQHIHRVVSRDGTIKWVNHQFESMAGSGGKVVSVKGILQDITQLKKTETDLLESQEQLLQRTHYAEAIIDASIDQITVFDTEERFIAWNKRCEEVGGLKREEVIGKKIIDLFPGMVNQPEFSEAHQKALQGGQAYIAAKEGIYSKGYHDWYYIPLKDQAGHVYAVLNIIHDVSEKVETENKLKAMNNELAAKNKLLEARNDEIANFAFIASHDLKEPLRKIHTFSNLIIEKESANLSDKGQEYITKLMNAVKRLDVLIEDVTALMQVATSKENFNEVDLHDVLQETHKELADSIKSSQAIIEAHALPAIRGHKKQLCYLFTNLLSNAIKFQQAEVIPVIEIRAGTYTNQNGLSFITLSFTDNGIGFEEQYAARIFNIFQRLHGQSLYPGTGIGLSICKKIMGNHGGYIQAKSAPGKGSTFTCFFSA